MKHKIFIGILFGEILILLFLLIHGGSDSTRRQEITDKKQVVTTLMLTDLSIWTEARYTRHPSQADLFSPFQDAPSSIEHFPAGSIIPPSPPIRIEKTARE